MKKIVVALAVLFLAASALACASFAYTVEVEDIEDNGWGDKVSEIVPNNTSDYGGILAYGDARVVVQGSEECALDVTSAFYSLEEVSPAEEKASFKGGDEEDVSPAENKAKNMENRLNGNISAVVIRHLDGKANDSFNVYAMCGDERTFLKHHTGTPGVEEWLTTPADIPVPCNLKGIEIEAEIDHSWSCSPKYGQLAIDSITFVGGGR